MLIGISKGGMEALRDPQCLFEKEKKKKKKIKKNEEKEK